MRLTAAHPHVDSDGTVWNVGTAFDHKKGYSYSIIKYQQKSPDWTGQ